MSLYVDSSALMKRYVEQADSASAERHLSANPVWVTVRLTYVEVHRNLPRLLDGDALSESKRAFAADWDRMSVVEVDAVTCEMAADIATATGARSLDALHLAAASRVGATALAFLTYDVRQAVAARALGLQVLGI